MINTTTHHLSFSLSAGMGCIGFLVATAITVLSGCFLAGRHSKHSREDREWEDYLYERCYRKDRSPPRPKARRYDDFLYVSPPFS
jgi:hypothetical protein